jgi:hypothetical protein
MLAEAAFVSKIGVAPIPLLPAAEPRVPEPVGQFVRRRREAVVTKVAHRVADTAAEPCKTGPLVVVPAQPSHVRPLRLAALHVP